MAKIKNIVIVLLSILCFSLFEGKVREVFAYEIEDINITLVYKNKKFVYKLSENEYKGSNFEIIGQKQTKRKRIKDMGYKQVITKMLSLQIEQVEIISYLLPNFNSVISTVKREFDVAPKCASVKFYPQSDIKFKYIDETEGVGVDEDYIYTNILNALCEEKNNIKLNLHFKSVSPEITTNHLKRSTRLRSRESTSFENSEEGRRSNLLKSMAKFDGLVVKPNGVVSFNRTTGPKTYQNGYKDAMIIVNGEFVKGIGGGVCQASTTIYNAALMAGLEIVSVSRHSLPVYYVTAGFDAMVSEGSDMVFRNNTNYPIYIHTYTSNERVYAEVYGEDMNGISYKRVSTKIRDIETDKDILKKDIEGKYSDKITYKGEYYRVKSPRPGFEIKGYLQTYKNGNFISEKLVRNEIYAAQYGIVYEGTKEPVEDTQLRDYGVTVHL